MRKEFEKIELTKRETQDFVFLCVGMVTSRLANQGCALAVKEGRKLNVASAIVRRYDRHSFADKMHNKPHKLVDLL